MIITPLGRQAFKLQYGDLTLVTNPIAEKGEMPRFGADIALVTLDHEHYNGSDLLSRGDVEPFVIDGPGDYEVKGIFVKGAGVQTNYDGESLINTMYSLTLDGISIGFLGTLSSKEISSEAREVIGSPDILFVSLGGGLNASDAYALATTFDPGIIIPMDFEHHSGMLDQFLKEAGQKPQALDKLTLKRKDLDGKEAEVVLLKA